jgi:dTDP-glucose 4,6-dehydratase/UDP-glucose 4-epimerase
VRVLDDESRGSRRRLADLDGHLEIVRGDVRDPEAVRAATRGMDAVAHLAAVNGTEHFYASPERVLEVAVKGALNTLDAAIHEGVGAYLAMSSSEVYQEPPVLPTDERVPLSIPDPLNPRYSYAGGKIVTELLALNYGRRHLQRTVVVRPHNVYGPDMGDEHVVPQLARRLRELDPLHPTGAVPLPIQGDGTQTRAFVFVDDFVDGCTRALLSGGNLEIYNVGTDVEVTIAHVATLVGRAFGREISLRPGPAPPGATPRRCPDISKIRALGYEPRTTLEDGIRRTVEWYRTH